MKRNARQNHSGAMSHNCQNKLRGMIDAYNVTRGKFKLWKIYSDKSFSI